jgi:hypothetical protein
MNHWFVERIGTSSRGRPVTRIQRYVRTPAYWTTAFGAGFVVGLTASLLTVHTIDAIEKMMKNFDITNKE